MIVREWIEFNRDNNKPLSSMGIGMESDIHEWMNAYTNLEIEDYRINPDGTIDIFRDINLVNKGLYILPDYIQFNKAYMSFYAQRNHWESLSGFPKEIEGDLAITSYSTKDRKWKQEEIRKTINVKGTIWN